MVGWVEYNAREGKREAILNSDGCWSCAAEPTVAEDLNRDFRPSGPPGTERWGHDELINAAHRLRGIAFLAPSD